MALAIVDTLFTVSLCYLASSSLSMLTNSKRPTLLPGVRKRQPPVPKVLIAQTSSRYCAPIPLPLSLPGNLFTLLLADPLNSWPDSPRASCIVSYQQRFTYRPLAVNLSNKS